MIFAIPAAIQTASTAAKIGAIVAVIAVIFSTGFYAGNRWETGNTEKAKAKYDNLVLSSKLSAATQDGKTSLENQRLLKEKELADEQNARARDSLAFYARQLQQLTKANANTSVMPGPTPGSEGINRTCFDRAELNRADVDYRTGEAERIERIHALVGEGTKATVDLDSAKHWAQKLPKPQTNN